MNERERRDVKWREVLFEKTKLCHHCVIVTNESQRFPRFVFLRHGRLDRFDDRRFAVSMFIGTFQFEAVGMTHLLFDLARKRREFARRRARFVRCQAAEGLLERVAKGA